MKYCCITLSLAIMSLVLFNSCDRPTTCVGEGTLISTPDGVKPVESLQVGDLVLSPDPLTKQIHQGRIVSIRSAIRECLVFSFEDGSNLLVTPEHPLWDPVTLTFKPAGEFASTDLISLSEAQSNSINSACIVGISTKLVMSKVYDLTVESDPRTFLANGVVVHNKLPPLEPGPPPVTDLAVEIIDSTSIRLIWTEPGAQSDTISIALFFFDTVAVTDTNLNYAGGLTEELIDAIGGSVDTVVTGGFDPSTVYYVRMQVYERNSAPSELSNSVSFTTAP